MSDLGTAFPGWRRSGSRIPPLPVRQIAASQTKVCASAFFLFGQFDPAANLRSACGVPALSASPIDHVGAQVVRIFSEIALFAAPKKGIKPDSLPKNVDPLGPI
jgi:hypothetical protein